MSYCIEPGDNNREHFFNEERYQIAPNKFICLAYNIFDIEDKCLSKMRLYSLQFENIMH